MTSRGAKLTVSLALPGLFAILGFESASAQYLECNTPVSSPDSLVVNQMAPTYPTSLDYADVRVYFHVLAQSDGSGGLSDAVIDSMYQVAALDLAALTIYVVPTGQDTISNSTYYSDPDSFAVQIFQENPHSDAIDIYLGPASGAAKGRAAGVPGTALVLTGSLTSYSALSHLLGNCLGLYETDETAFGVENPDSSNSGSTGDLVTDTAADPGLHGWVEGDCTLSSNFSPTYPGYSPDPTNIMSGAPMACWERFTDGQRARALAALETCSVVAAAVIAIVPDGPYRDYSSSTNLRNFLTFPEDRSNAAAFDFYGDSKKDIVVAGAIFSNDSHNEACAGQCTGYDNANVPYFVDQTNYVFNERPRNGTTGIIVADYDNDGDLDFYAPNPGWNTVPANPHHHALYRNDSGWFTNVTSTAFETDQIEAVTLTGAWGDYDGDGFLDLVVGNSPSNPGNEQFAVGLTVYHNEDNGQGGRQLVRATSTGIPSTDTNVFSLLWVDLDQDHDMDLVTINNKNHDDPPSSRYYRNNGSTFSDVSTTNFGDRSDLYQGGTFAAAADLDNDGDLDIGYQGKIIRGYFQNTINQETGNSTLSQGVFETPGFNEQWQMGVTDFDIFDFNLDGKLDYGVSNSFGISGSSYARLLKNIGGAFEDYKVPGSNGYARGLGAADWSMDGYTELFSASQDNENFFFRNANAADGTGSSHWVGIRLDASVPGSTDCPCNSRGIGATVIVRADSTVQAQIVDGGSGHAGQHDLDLSFGLGAYADSVDVEIIWPCGQTQYDRVPIDQYNTLELGWPEIESVTPYIEWDPGSSTVSWVFEWVTSSPSDESLDYVSFPNGVVDGSNTVYELHPTDNNVEYAVDWAVADGYRHALRWTNRPCDQIMTVPYRIHSKALGKEFTGGRFLYVYSCPQN